MWSLEITSWKTRTLFNSWNSFEGFKFWRFELWRFEIWTLSVNVGCITCMIKTVNLSIWYDCKWYYERSKHFLKKISSLILFSTWGKYFSVASKKNAWRFCMRLNVVIKHFLESFLQRIEISKLNPVRKMYHKNALF